MGAGEADGAPPSAFYVDNEAAGAAQHGPVAVQPVSVEVDGKEHISLDLGGGCSGLRIAQKFPFELSGRAQVLLLQQRC